LLPISRSAAAQYLATDYWIGSDTILGCRFLDRQRHNFLPPISRSAAAQSLLSISESAATQFLIAGF